MGNRILQQDLQISFRPFITACFFFLTFLPDILPLQILQLYTSLQTSRSVILLGCPGSGKSTIYSTLASALNTLNGKATQPVMKTRRQPVAERKLSSALKQAKAPVEEIKDILWPRVDLSVVFPKSLTCEEVSYEIYGVVKIPKDVRRTYSQYRYKGGTRE